MAQENFSHSKIEIAVKIATNYALLHQYEIRRSKMIFVRALARKRVAKPTTSEEKGLFEKIVKLFGDEIRRMDFFWYHAQILRGNANKNREADWTPSIAHLPPSREKFSPHDKLISTAPYTSGGFP